MNFERIKADLMALVLLALTVFAGLALYSYDPADPPSSAVYPVRETPANLCGPIGANISHTVLNSIGIGAWFLFATLAVAVVRYLFKKPVKDPGVRSIGVVLSLLAFVTMAQLWVPSFGGGAVLGSGGYFGVWGVALLESNFSTVGTIIICGAVFTAGLILSGQIVFITMFLSLLTWPIRAVIRSFMSPEKPTDLAETETARSETSTPEPQASELVDDPEEEPAPELAEEPADEDSVEEPAIAAMENKRVDDKETPRKPIKVNPPATARARELAMRNRQESKVETTTDDEFELPALDMLEDAEEFPYDLLAKKAQVAAMTLEKTFQEFGLNIRVAEIDTGPVITQFELELEPGLRLNKVTALADDLAIALRVPSVRVVAPIPGKNTVGVEVPNEKQVMVRLREIIESSPDNADKMRLPLFLGKDVSGHPLAVDLTKLPHLLIAGRTGTGKSVCLNTLILSMLMTRSPDDVKMLMIDPKMVELSPYKRVPHLMHPVITDMKKAEAVLAWAVDKMEERYDLLARCGVRHLDGYNKLGSIERLERLGIDPDDPDQAEEANEIPDRMPYIVIIADEMADMMMTSGKDVEGHIIRLAQKSRAVGIHLVLATQKPTVDVITGLIKSNLPSRISFQVASRTDSRVVLDELGAERLLGNGDMLYLAPGTSNITRAQGTYVGDDEINRVIDFYAVYEPQYSNELAQISSGKTSRDSQGTDPSRIEDDLYEEAIEVIIREGRGSVSLLQRALGIGYGRGARLIDYMAEDGIVGDYNGSQAREVLYTPEQWEAMKNGAELEPVGV